MPDPIVETAEIDPMFPADEITAPEIASPVLMTLMLDMPFDPEAISCPDSEP